MSVPGAGLLALLRKRSEPEAGLLGAAAAAPAAASPAAAGTPAGQSKYEARSAAVHALEHAVAAGTVGEAARSLAQGRRIPPGPSYTYDVDVHAPHEAQPQLPVTPVTLITTDYALHHYRQNAVSAAYICYGLKQGHVRVLARSSAVRALLKGHAKPLTDLQFAGGSGAGQAGSEGGALLASGGQDGQLYVWHLQLDEDGEAIHESQKLHASFVKEGGASAGDVFLSWHSPSKRVLAVGAGGRVLLVAAPLEGMEQLEFDLDDDSTPDATVLPDWCGEVVTCLSFSPDGQLLAAGGAAGTVRVWQLQQAADTAPTASPMLVAAHSSSVSVATSGAAVGAVRWLPTPGGWVLLTGNRNNVSLQLWHAAGDAAAAPLEWTPLQALRFEGKDGQAEFYNQLDVVPSQQLVVLADTARKAVYTLHYSGTGDQLAFDYVARFGVAVPILSFTALWNPCGGAEGEANGGESPAVELHCVQTTAIQQYSLDPALCNEGSSAEPEEAEERGVTRRSSLLERHGKDVRLPIQAQPSSAVPMPSEELATGTPRGVASPAAPPAEQLPVPASEEAVAAAEAAAAPHLEPSIDETVPLASIPLPPAPEPPVPKGASGEVTPEECPSPPPTPTEQQRLVAEAAALAAAEAAASAAVVPPAPRLLTPSDLLQSTEASSAATTGRSSPSSAVEAGSRAAAAAAAAAAPQPPVRILQRPEEVLPGAAAAQESEELAAAPPSPAAAAGAAPAAAAAGGAVDEAVAAAVLDQMGGVHKRFVGHVSLMYRELLKAMKTELSAQAAAQQQATAQLLAQALEAQKQQIEAERAAVLAEERGNIERLLTAISATLNRDLPARLQEAVRGELASIGDSVAASVAPAVQAALAASLPKELSSAIKAGLDKQLAPAVAAGLSGKPLQEAFRSAFAKQLVPAFEAGTQAMFQQIQTAFAAGFEEHLQATRSSLAEPAKLVAQLAASLSSAQSLAASLSQGQQQLLRAQSIGGAPSGALSPAAQVDVRGELSSLLRSHQYEQAFSRALGLQDVATVGWLCTQADAAAVLSRDPCPLSQMVLLSLVQQVSADLTTHLAAKLAWIREAALQLNPKDPVLARHLRPVLEGVHAALAAAAARASGPDAASCRLALHVVHSQMTS